MSRSPLPFKKIITQYNKQSKFINGISNELGLFNIFFYYFLEWYAYVFARYISRYIIYYLYTNLVLCYFSAYYIFIFILYFYFFLIYKHIQNHNNHFKKQFFGSVLEFNKSFITNDFINNFLFKKNFLLINNNVMPNPKFCNSTVSWWKKKIIESKSRITFCCYYWRIICKIFQIFLFKGFEYLQAIVTEFNRITLINITENIIEVQFLY